MEDGGTLSSTDDPDVEATDAKKKLNPFRGARRAVTSTMSTVGNTVDGVGKAVGSTVDGVGKVVGTTVDGVGKVVGTTVDGVGKVVGTTVGGVGKVVGGTVEAVESVGEAVGEAVEQVGEAVGVAVGKVEQLGFEFVTESNPRLERMGMNYFRKRALRGTPVEVQEDAHILDAEEHSKLRAIGRAVIWRAALIGALSGLAGALGEHWAAEAVGEPETFGDSVVAFLMINGVMLVATLLEIFFLYWDALASVEKLAKTAGISLAAATEEGASERHQQVALALARAALELPNPPKNRFGINPHREISKWRVFFTGLFYKLKITITNFLLKAVIRRAAGRVVAKTYLFYVAVPVTAAWDAAVAWRVIREARIRVIGPSAAEALVRSIHQQVPELSDQCREMMLRAVASSVVRTHDLHPNLAALMRALLDGVDISDGPDLDDTAAFIAAMPALEGIERDVVLEVLAVATVIDGSLARHEVRLMRETLEAVGRTLDKRALKTLARAFVSGQPLDGPMIADVIGGRDAATPA